MNLYVPGTGDDTTTAPIGGYWIHRYLAMYTVNYVDFQFFYLDIK